MHFCLRASGESVFAVALGERGVAFGRIAVAATAGAAAFQAVAALLGWVFALKGLWHPFWIFSPWFVIVFGQGLALPNLTANAVALAPRYAGAAAGLLGFIQQILGAIAVQAMATSSTATPIPVTAFVAGAALLAWITLKLGPRPGG